MRITQKLRSKRGETLIEMLVSIVLLGLSVALMLTMVMTSTKITKITRTEDEKMMNELNFAEKQQQDAGVEKTVTITCTSGSSGSVPVTVNLYSESGSDLISYSIPTTP